MEKRKPLVVFLLAAAIAITAYGVKAGDHDLAALPPIGMGGSGMPMYGYPGGMPMMQGPQGGMPMYGYPGGMPMMQGPQGGMPMYGYPGGVPMSHHDGMTHSHGHHHGRGQQHMQQVEARLANIEALLRELVALQRAR